MYIACDSTTKKPFSLIKIIFTGFEKISDNCSLLLFPNALHWAEIICPFEGGYGLKTQFNLARWHLSAFWRNAPGQGYPRNPRTESPPAEAGAGAD